MKDDFYPCTKEDVVFRNDSLARFYAENEAKVIRRLPSWIVPENAFNGFGVDDAAMALQKRKLELVRDESDWNVLTWTCRVTFQDDPIIMSRLMDAVRELKGSGIDLLMDLEPRLLQRSFFEKYPDDYLLLRQFAVFSPDNDGVVHFEVKEDSFGDFGNLSGINLRYSGWREGRLVAARIAKERTLKPVDAMDVVCTNEVVSGKVSGLAADETLLVEVEWPLYQADPSSPNVMRFCRELAKRYAAIGVSGVMRDEYGFQKPNTPTFKSHLSYWYSPCFAELYARRSGGRKLDEDLPALALAWDIPEVHSAAIAYTMAIYDACKASEVELYNLNKEYFGADAYVAKHVTWHRPFEYDELLHNGLGWWAAKRDWAQSDECHPVPVNTAMTKKFGSPLWLDEGYGPNPRHYVKRLWQYTLCGGRIVYHSIFSWNRSEESVSCYTNPYECAFHRIADLLNYDGIRAAQIVRLLPLMTRAPIDCPVVQIFGHERLTDWLSPDFKDWGEEIAYGLGHKGYYVDVYPASEIPDGTFAIDGDGFITVGQQRYKACVLWHLSDSENQAWRKLLEGRKLATRIFIEPSVGEVEAFLLKIGATLQAPLEKTRERLPNTEGLLHLTDGTVAHIKGGLPDFAGDLISGELNCNGTPVSYRAKGLFAVRVENGRITAFCGGELTYVNGPGISLKLDTPQDISLVCIDGIWYGTCQSQSPEEPIPAQLMEITAHWVKLCGVSPDIAPSFDNGQ